jgi:hypothetical protein
VAYNYNGKDRNKLENTHSVNFVAQMLATAIQSTDFVTFMVSGGDSGAGGRTYWVCGSGDWTVLICLKLQCDKVS